MPRYELTMNQKKISSRSHAIGSQETFNYLRSGCIDLEMKDSMERVVQQE